MRVKIEDVCDKATSNLKQSDVMNKKGLFPVFGAAGYLGKIDTFHQSKPYVAIVKDGAGIGRTMLLPAKSSVIGTMQYLLPKDNILPAYLYYVIKARHLEKYFSGATIPHIYFKDYKNEQFDLVNFEKQKQIVHKLKVIEKIMTNLNDELKLFDELIKARFVEVFGDPIKNDKSWKQVKLMDLGLLARGISKHRPRNAVELLGGPYPLVQTGEVANADTYITSYLSTYSELGLKQSKMWPKGTLCITIAANIAQTSILTFDACFPDSVVGFIAGERVETVFVHYWFSFLQSSLEALATQVAQKNLNLKTLSNVEVIVPPIQLQSEFVNFTKQVDKSKFINRR
ncbi:restriction endonuclease subunit S [Massilimicrobiota timonensis]|uniref:restriction endonuclease subunit S n=1 Tax=Massilimicrobiota timonensis TaxID=1776392 RepID=UPI00101BAD98|nr:restriction endonuclease subunit S [Massilimicrobiota timonensis]